MDNSYGFKDAAHSDAPIKARQIYLKGILEGSQELIPRCGESGWSEDDGIPNPDVRMIKVKTKSCNTKNIVMVAGAAGALLVSAFLI